MIHTEERHLLTEVELRVARSLYQRRLSRVAIKIKFTEYPVGMLRLEATAANYRDNQVYPSTCESERG